MILAPSAPAAAGRRTRVCGWPRRGACARNNSPKMQPPRPRFAPHPLPYDCRSRRFDAEHSHIIEVAPAGKVRQQLPDCLDWSLDDGGGTSEIGWRHTTSGTGGRSRSGNLSSLPGKIQQIPSGTLALGKPRETDLGRSGSSGRMEIGTFARPTLERSPLVALRMRGGECSRMG